MAWLLAPLALLIERVLGYPPPLFKAIGHPVTWMGALIGWLVHVFSGRLRPRPVAVETEVAS